jgi:hypothetical protein
MKDEGICPETIAVQLAHGEAKVLEGGKISPQTVSNLTRPVSLQERRRLRAFYRT